MCLGSLAVGLLIGIFDLGDSYIYATFGELLYFKWYIPMPPFTHDIPQTLFGPIYSLIILPILKLPAPLGMVLLPTIQTGMVFTAGVVVYALLKKMYSRRAGLVAFCIFISFPFTLIYATVIMSEIIAMFLVSLYILLIYGWLSKSKWSSPAIMLFLSAVMVLTRYVFLPLFCISFVLWILDRNKGWRMRMWPGLVGIILIIWWLAYNFNLSGSIGLSTVMGRHLYNNVVTSARLTPPYPHPVTDFFFTGIPKDSKYLFAPWWDNQNQFNDGIRTQLSIDRMYLRVSLLTILYHPFEYALNVLREFYLIPTTQPVYNPKHITFLSTCPQVQCQVNWNTTLCYPAVFVCPVRKAFSSLIQFQESLYPYPMNIFFILAMVGVLTAVIKGTVFWRYTASIFFIQHIFQSATEWVEGRFIIPLYPLYVLLIVYGSIELFRKVFTIKTKHIRNPYIKSHE